VIHREAAVRTVRSSNGQPAGSRPCAHCGRPVPQPYSGNQIFRYCRDNEGACQRAARRIGLHRVGGPGLGDHVARAVVVTERLEHVVDALNEALHANLSPAGVERQIAAVRGEAAAAVAAAHAQRDEARQEAHQARDDAEQARREADLARDDARQARAEAATAQAWADEAAARATVQAEAVDRLTAERDAAHRELAQVQVERDRAVAAAAELTRARAEVARLQADLERSRTDAGRHNNRLTAAVASLREEVARSQQHGYEQESVRQSAERRAEALAVRLRAAETERDAARAELDSARFQAARIDEQVSNLASALARLGTATRADVPVPIAPAAPVAAAAPIAPAAPIAAAGPAGWVTRDQKSA